MTATAATHLDFEYLLEAAPDPVFVTECGRIVLVNDATALVFGYTKQELMGASIDLLLPERFREKHQAQRGRYERAPRRRPMGSGLELFARRKDGTELPVEISLSPAHIDERTLVISIVRDISERKRAQEGIARAEQELIAAREAERHRLQVLLSTVSHILDGMTEPVVVIAADGRIVRVNEAACRLFKRKATELLGQLAHDVFHWEDEGGRLLEDDEYAFHQTFAMGAPVSANGRYLRRGDRGRVPVCISSAPVLDEEHGVQVAVEVIRDISREREAEELKDRIISLVSHELRTPIGHIKGFASSLLEPDLTWDEATQRDFITEIDREADRLATLVTDLLDMSKIESGEDFLERDWRRPAAVVQQALKALERLTADHVLVVDVPSDLPDVFADGGQLERVIGNLVENAAKYTDPGTKIEVSARRTNSELEFSVADRGSGIAPEYQERIFERFFRVKGGPAPKPGTGLGLPICRGIVQAHGGRLWFEEREGGGACFRFTIPLQPASTEHAI